MVIVKILLSIVFGIFYLIFGLFAKIGQNSKFLGKLIFYVLLFGWVGFLLEYLMIWPFYHLHAGSTEEGREAVRRGAGLLGRIWDKIDVDGK